MDFNQFCISNSPMYALPVNQLSAYVWYLSYLLGVLNDCFYTKSSDILNKNTLGVKKVRGQEEAVL